MTKTEAWLWFGIFYLACAAIFLECVARAIDEE
jgi:hypothetical protein